MKKVLLSVLMTTALLVGCGTGPAPEVTNESYTVNEVNNKVEDLSGGYDIQLYVDKETGVNYYILYNSFIKDSTAISMVERKNPDGSLYITE